MTAKGLVEARVTGSEDLFDIRKMVRKKKISVIMQDKPFINFSP
jgi:hypothetical protein